MDGANRTSARGTLAPEVGVVELKEQDVLLSSDLPGRTPAYQVTEVHPKVSGIVHKRLFTESAVVRKGQQLYQIEPALYQAAFDKADASRDTARNLAQRLLETKAISRRQFDNAQANWKQADPGEALRRVASLGGSPYSNWLGRLPRREPV